MKTTSLAILSIFFLFACDDPENPLGDVVKQEWFKNLQVPCKKDDICKAGIMQGMYLDNTVVYFSYLNGGYCDTFFYVKLYSEEGEIVKIYDESNPFDFYEEVTSYVPVWTCSCGYTATGLCFPFKH